MLSFSVFPKAITLSGFHCMATLEDLKKNLYSMSSHDFTCPEVKNEGECRFKNSAIFKKI
jgi:hypothetical protein